MTNRDVTASDQPASIEIQGLPKRFGAFTAVDNVSFQVRRGEVLGFLGPNSAARSMPLGKTCWKPDRNCGRCSWN